MSNLIRKIDISIVIVNWNTKDLLAECLHSLESQNCADRMEIIVVDNASWDDSVQMVKRDFPYVKVIQNQENLGFARGNNIGISQSSGRYVCLVNSDVRLLPDCLSRLVHQMEQDTTIGIIGPKVLWPDMTLQDSCRKFPGLWNNFCELLRLNRLFPKANFFSGEHMKHFDHMTTKNVDGLVGCFLMIRRTALDQAGVFDERFFIYSEETDLCKRFRQQNWKIVFYPGAVIIHYGRKSSERDPFRFSFEQLKSKIKYWKKHHSRPEVAAFLLIVLLNQGAKLATDSVRYLTSPKDRSQITERLFKNFICLRYILLRKYADA